MPMPSFQRFYTPTLLLSLGALSIVLLFVNNSIRERVMVRDVEVARQVAEVETRMATLHLWVEEYVTGDTVDLEEVRQHQSESQRILDELLAGPLLDGGDAGPERELLAAIGPRVSLFSQLSTQRIDGYDAGRDVGVGSATDVAYDEVFYALSDDMRRLSRRMAEKVDAAHAQSVTLFRVMLMAWSAIVGIAVAAVWNREMRHREAEEALRRSEAKLLQAQKMEAIGSLAGGLAHDINNYLAAISAQCEVVRMRAATGSPVIEKMGLVMETCGRASALLQRLLAFSRGRPVQPEVASLNRVVRALEEMARRLIGENVQLDLRLGDSLWPAEIEVSQIEQSVLNLLVNARDAMPTGGEVAIETRNVPAAESPLEPAGDCVALRVSDIGPGIAPELRDKIFEPFFTTKGKSTNSGLGLATVYGIVRQNGGIIQLADVAGRGATFDLFFPRSLKSLKPSTKPAPEAIPSREGVRLLLVEDNEELRVSTEEILREMGIDVRSAADGIAALELFDRADRPFEVLMTDVVMPGMNGSELAEEIVTRDPSVQVLYASGYTDNVVLQHGVDEEAFNFLPKPYSAGALMRAIDRVLAGR